MTKVTHIRKVKPDLFADWLERNHHSGNYPYLRGQVWLGPAARYPALGNPSRVVLAGVYSYDTEREGRLVCHSSPFSTEYIRFELIPLDDIRTEITTTYEDIPSIAEYCQGLLAKMEQRWHDERDQAAPTMQAQSPAPSKPNANHAAASTADAQSEQVKSKDDSKGQHLKMQWSVKIIGKALFVLAVLIPLVSNIASNTLPEEWKPYLWLSWPLLVILVILGAILSRWHARKTETNNA
jgi:hypothetical protein